MVRRPTAATARMLSIQISVCRAAPSLPRWMSSGTGILSTIVHFSGVRPAGVFSIKRFRSATAFCGQTSPGAY